jgi:hypothetical protein
MLCFDWYIKRFGPNQIAAIENYRNTIGNVVIITFDEMIQRIKGLLDVFKADEAFDEIADKIVEDDIPF